MGLRSWTVELPDEARSEAFGAALGALLRGGDAVGLVGALGAGKTTLCRGIGVGLACVTPLRSPSYLLCHEIQGRVPVLHMDAYFEERMDALLAEGLCARFDAEHVLLIEWADRLSAWWPEDRLEILLETAGEGRLATLRALGPAAEERLQGLQTAWNSGGKA